MREEASSFPDHMHSAAGKQHQPLRRSFDPQRVLPEPLAPLYEVAANFYWSWSPTGVSLFRDLDPTLWQQCEQNPRLLLKTLDPLRLWERGLDVGYISRLISFVAEQREYLGTPANEVRQITTERPIAYFCAEYGIHNSLPIYSGGLGILAGDHLKSASGLGVPLVAVGLLYRYGFFRQRIGHDGWQEEAYVDVFDSELALDVVTDENGEPILSMVHIRGREVFARAWRANVGRITLYLLDTNVEQNADVDRLITGHLYGGDTETRIVQEKILGIGGVRLLRTLGINPSVYHLNEGHSAFLTLELAREYIAASEDATFKRRCRGQS